ncbi:nuclear transport factor 2 family protein [Gluconobacter cerinus]|nr:nuclear transport factor 2 family protein [Gluconobacter cerinus]
MTYFRESAMFFSDITSEDVRKIKGGFMPLEKHERTIRQMFATFTDFTSDISGLSNFMTTDYRQFVDGQEMTLDDFRTHTTALRSGLRELDISIQHILCDGDNAATVHFARATRHSGEHTLIKVIAFYRFRGAQICLVDELTHVIEGHHEDKALGSLQ